MAIISAATALGGMLVYAWTNYQALSTDDERKAAIEVYDHGYQGELKDNEDWKKGGLPAKTRKELQQVEALLQKTRAEQVQADKDLKKLWWWQIGYVASDGEPCKKLKANAAAHAREQFLLVLQEDPEASYEVAYRRALNKPWHARNRLVRAGGCR